MFELLVLKVVALKATIVVGTQKRYKNLQNVIKLIIYELVSCRKNFLLYKYQLWSLSRKHFVQYLIRNDFLISFFYEVITVELSLVCLKIFSAETYA